MSDFLERMAASSLARARAAPAPPPPVSPPVCFPADRSFAVIAEIKRVSPAEGELGSNDDIVARARRYAAGGAAAISVLTEPERFGGSLDDLAAVARALPGVPVMRKDFLVENIQIDEARAAGASGVLLIAAMLDEQRLGALTDAAVERDMFVLLEAFDAADLATIVTVIERDVLAPARAAGQVLVGVNTRDLRTLAVDTGRLAVLAPHLPDSVRAIAESGIGGAADAAAAARLGYRGALVGTALMRTSEPATLLGDLVTAGASPA